MYTNASSVSGIVLAQTPTVTRPPEGAFYDPAFRQYLESFDPSVPFDDLKPPGEPSFHPVEQLTTLCAICPHFSQARKPPEQFTENQFGAIPILNVGGVDNHAQEQAQRVHHNVALPSSGQLATIKTTDSTLFRCLDRDFT